MIPDQTITREHMTCNIRDNWCVKWVYGISCRCSAGCCCNWTVPSCVRRANFELWGAGGNGNGACSCNRCHHTKPPGGGNYTSKSITTNAGCTYTVCAAGVYRCLSRECYGCNGCTTWVRGYNLANNFCACGGQRGCANTAWTDACFSTMEHCTNSFCNCSGTSRGVDFTMNTHGGNFQGQSAFMYPGWACHCWKHNGHSTGAPALTANYNEQNSNVCWIRCGCWIVPYGAGGQSATSNYCGRCCGQGGTGGGGLVKITFF